LKSKAKTVRKDCAALMSENFTNYASIWEFFRTVIRVIDGRFAEVDECRIVEDRLESHID